MRLPSKTKRIPDLMTFQKTLAVLLCISALSQVQAKTPGQTKNPVDIQSSSNDFLQLADLSVKSGLHHTMSFDGVIERVAIGDPAVLDVQLLKASGNGGKSTLLVTPKKVGQSSLMIWSKGRAQPTKQTVLVGSSSLVLDTQFNSLPEMATAYEALRKNGGKDAVIGDASSLALKSNTVQVEVKVVEFRKSELKQMGINLFTGGVNSHGFQFGSFGKGVRIPATGAPAVPIASAMNLVMNWSKAWGGAGLGVQLSLLENNQMARVLAEPTLVAQSGQSASFLAGGELPVPVAGGLGQTSIEYKPFGISLQLTPTVLANNRIALKVAPEASDLDFSNGVVMAGVSVPAIKTRRADTTVELGDGESFVIGGLVSRSTTSAIDKVPLLGDLPIIGTFFKNSQYQRDESELVIVVTPKLVQPIAADVALGPLLPGATQERSNAKVWQKMLLGGTDQSQFLPGFSR